MQKYLIYWLDGKTEKVVGHDISDAFRRAGYSGGAMNAVDYYREIE